MIIRKIVEISSCLIELFHKMYEFSYIYVNITRNKWNNEHESGSTPLDMGIPNFLSEYQKR